AVAGLDPLHTVAYGLDYACYFAAGRKRPRRLELIAILDDEQVGIVDPAGLHGNEHLAGAGLGIGQFFKHQRVRPAYLLAQHGLHRRCLLELDLGWCFELAETDAGVDHLPCRRVATGAMRKGVVCASVTSVPATPQSDWTVSKCCF